MMVTELARCPSCEAHDPRPYSIGGITRLNRCGRCGLVYAPEFVDPEEIYVDGYLTGKSALGFGLDIFDPYFQAFLGYAADARMRRIARFAPPPGTLLDVGCGSGETLQGAMRAGWTAVGVEPVEESAKIAQDRGLDVRCCVVEDSGLERSTYDVVTAFHVLEHMTEATAFLRTTSAYARPGGHVVVEVPNLRSVHRKGYGAAWPGLRALEHISHFTPRTLRDTFRRAGLEDVRVQTIGFLWPGQTLSEMLNDLGLNRLAPRLERLGRPGYVIGREGVVPRRSTRRALLLAEAALDRLKLGPAVLGIGRVPLR
jgi:SAM-dependent methyltransferase